MRAHQKMSIEQDEFQQDLLDSVREMIVSREIQCIGLKPPDVLDDVESKMSLSTLCQNYVSLNQENGDT